MSNLSELLLEKYKPKRYFELLTDERINREILTWMKSWDEIVFGKTQKPGLKQIYSTDQNKIGFNNGLNAYEKYLNELDYKNYKYIILTGPPGIGKTTLAEIIGTKCGYEPKIVNASEERTAETLINKIDNATKGHNISFNKGAGYKPTLLILDEVDGINTGDDANVAKQIASYIKTGIYKREKDKSNQTNKGLLSLRRQDNKASLSNVEHNDIDSDEENEKMTNTKDNDTDETKTKKNVSHKIFRPIILICNDIYSKAITPLKKDAMIFYIKKVNQTRLLERLIEINKNEKINLPEDKIKIIMEKSDYDIRRCLNLIQFINYNKNNKELLESINLKEVSLGHSDLNQSFFEVWKKILNEPFTEITNKYTEIANLYNSAGDYEILNDGLFVNYLKSARIRQTITDQEDLEGKEICLEKIAAISDALSYSEKDKKIIYSKDSMLPGLFISNVLLSNKKEKKKEYKDNIIEFPTNLRRNYIKQQNNFKIISYLNFNYNNETGLYMNNTQFFLEVLPFLTQLIIPNVRELSVDLLNINEKKRMFLSVLTIIRLGLKISITDTEIDIKPNIFKLVSIENEEGLDYEKYHRKMMILLNEINRISMMRKYHPGSETIIESKHHSEEKDNFEYYYGHLDKTNDRKRFNMFDKKKRSLEDTKDSESLFYIKFNEGLSNSVKRNTSLSTFLN